MFAPAEPIVGSGPITWSEFEIVIDRFFTHDPFGDDWLRVDDCALARANGFK